MYFPYLRGRQFELIAVRELAEASVLSDNVIPIIEPVRLSSTLNSTIIQVFCFIQCGNQDKKLAYIYNPKVGTLFEDARKDKIGTKLEELKKLVIEDKNVIKAIIIDSKVQKYIDELKAYNIESSDIMALCLERDVIPYYEKSFSSGASYNVVPYGPSFRRIRGNRILIDDKFLRRDRNVDYLEQDEEFYSDDHLYYKEDGYIGFADYSIVGNDYQETGFAPYAVAIHIVYFSNLDNSLRVKHFVSDTNDDISDPANKFGEAVAKLVDWNKRMKLDTLGIRTFEDMHNTGAYPGLGVVKKLSIMHHIELMGKYLDGISK
mgnify:CR=1 FL=1